MANLFSPASGRGSNDSATTVTPVGNSILNGMVQEEWGESVDNEHFIQRCLRRERKMSNGGAQQEALILH